MQSRKSKQPQYRWSTPHVTTSRTPAARGIGWHTRKTDTTVHYLYTNKKLYVTWPCCTNATLTGSIHNIDCCSVR